MAEYIDKNKILDRLDRLMHIATEPPMDADDKAQWVLLRELHKEFSELPTAEVEEVLHGEWELKSEIHRFFEEIDEEFYVECPFCQKVYYVPFEFEDKVMLKYAKENYPYCHCGAKMDGGKEE